MKRGEARGSMSFAVLVRLATAIIVTTGVACGQTDNNILVKVGDRTISILEFRQRSEMTVRPDNLKNKNTTLNNLILEKVLALEAAKDDRLASNPGIQARLKGIKEQAMRERLFYDAAFKKVNVDTARLKRAYRLSIREYDLEFYRMHRPLAEKVRRILDSIPNATDDVFKGLSEYAGKEPVHKVSYKDRDDAAIHEALFSKPLRVGDVVGPIELGANDYLVMKVLTWTDFPLLSGIDQQVRWNEVREEEHRLQALKMWESYQKGIMRGKKIEFNRRTFTLLANWVREKHIIEQQKNDSAGVRMPEVPFNPKGLDLSLPFFTFDNATWTVGEFRTELTSHPFVFRTTQLDSANFNRQFELAVVDIMRDHCLTAEAYRRSLDRGEDIVRKVRMWKDSFAAIDRQKAVIETALRDGKIHEKDAPGILKFWESYVRDLQKKYSDSIYVNEKAFKNISLTKIDMVAVKFGVPYPVVVPDFPSFVFSENLDYALRQK